jgi:hypothetical protein
LRRSKNIERLVVGQLRFRSIVGQFGLHYDINAVQPENELTFFKAGVSFFLPFTHTAGAD